MADPDIITSDNITIIYQQAQLPLATFPSTTRSVPSIATDILRAEFLDDPEYWVDEISVRSDQDFSVKMKLNTSQTCTNQYTGKAMYVTMTYSISADNVQGGATYSYDLAYLKGNQRMYCVSLIEIETSVQNTADTPPTFALQTTVIGCKIDPGKYMLMLQFAVSYKLIFMRADQIRVFILVSTPKASVISRKSEVQPIISQR